MIALVAREAPMAPAGNAGGERHRTYRQYELVYSTYVSPPEGGWAEAEVIGLVSILREDWEPGEHLSRIRIMHTAPELGPLELVLTGVPMPWVVRLNGGEISPFRVVQPVPVGLEIRPVGRVAATRALGAFELLPDSSYTIVIAVRGEHASQFVAWTPDYAG
ncbi:MAG TPA: hypothetical protein VJN95_11105 [Gemmatimonadales bacterium]|nr:hypothetical protein [Gemmatimonadales bacterium]